MANPRRFHRLRTEQPAAAGGEGAGATLLMSEYYKEDELTNETYIPSNVGGLCATRLSCGTKVFDLLTKVPLDAIEYALSFFGRS